MGRLCPYRQTATAQSVLPFRDRLLALFLALSQPGLGEERGYGSEAGLDHGSPPESLTPDCMVVQLVLCRIVALENHCCYREFGEPEILQ